MNSDGSMDEQDWVKLRRQVAAERARFEKRRKDSAANKLHRKLLECGYCVHKPERLYHGHWQRSSGAWVWQAVFDDSITGRAGCVGSQETMKTCALMSNKELVEEMNSYYASSQPKHKLANY